MSVDGAADGSARSDGAGGEGDTLGWGVPMAADAEGRGVSGGSVGVGTGRINGGNVGSAVNVGSGSTVGVGAGANVDVGRGVGCVDATGDGEAAEPVTTIGSSAKPRSDDPLQSCARYAFALHV